MGCSTIVATEDQAIQRVSVALPNGICDLSPAERAALLSRGVWLIYQQITKLAGMIMKTDRVKA